MCSCGLKGGISNQNNRGFLLLILWSWNPSGKEEGKDLQLSVLVLAFFNGHARICFRTCTMYIPHVERFSIMIKCSIIQNAPPNSQNANMYVRLIFNHVFIHLMNPKTQPPQQPPRVNSPPHTSTRPPPPSHRSPQPAYQVGPGTVSGTRDSSPSRTHCMPQACVRIRSA